MEHSLKKFLGLFSKRDGLHDMVTEMTTLNGITAYGIANLASLRAASLLESGAGVFASLCGASFEAGEAIAALPGNLPMNPWHGDYPVHTEQAYREEVEVA